LSSAFGVVSDSSEKSSNRPHLNSRSKGSFHPQKFPYKSGASEIYIPPVHVDGGAHCTCTKPLQDSAPRRANNAFHFFLPLILSPRATAQGLIHFSLWVGGDAHLLARDKGCLLPLYRISMKFSTPVVFTWALFVANQKVPFWRICNSHTRSAHSLLSRINLSLLQQQHFKWRGHIPQKNSIISPQ
jgi:hypothetical protein